MYIYIHMYIYIYIYTYNIPMSIPTSPVRFLQFRADGQVLALGRRLAHQDAAQRGRAIIGVMAHGATQMVKSDG